ncbi:cellulose synthase operon protein YhjQ [Pseudomonas knackmussii B13]|uniref:Cellulose synthase operon protein YhjQ n=1 Tax=Pseudomonas knackmussii (strain DSM 6978 / CCUG 54928 / LMG 23759 / B13) TaxID=1301098 RepID=A0A024HIR0_PSEKB|nr:cellulose biosynthesis protein BcsQ [Pseudomonas knackmussii]CDF84392.1 cellulose synthase operon protein YhjQ [Pseudomonas knackmussii B13]
MYRSDDISNLFRKLGESAESYREIEPELDYVEEPPLAAACVSAALAVAAPAVAAQPATADTNAPAPAPGAPLASRPRTLSDLLAEATRRRESLQSPEFAPQQHGKGSPRVITLVSGKGGVGRSTLVAALACALQNEKGRTLALDLDPQNALCLHLGGDAEQPGLIQGNSEGLSWDTLVQRGFAHSQYLPYGSASLEQQRALEQRLRDDPQWLARHLAQLGLDANDRVIIDTPAGASAYLDQALAVADLVLVVTLADAASYHALNHLERLLAPNHQREDAAPCHYLINQLDNSRAFSLDMAEVLQGHLGERLLGMVQLDHYLGESLAYARNPFAREPVTPGCRDLLGAAANLSEALRQTARQESTLS